MRPAFPLLRFLLPLLALVAYPRPATAQDAPPLPLTASTLPLTAPVQERSGQDLPGPQSDAARPETIAVIPWNYEYGTDGAKRTADLFLTDLLTRAAHLNVVRAMPLTERASESERAQMRDLSESEFARRLPTPQAMLAYGRRMGVDWVLAGRARWHTRSLFIGTGPKTKADCTLDMRIVDVRRREVALDARDVKMDSTAKESGLETFGAVFVSWMITGLSGGPKTPQQERAVELAMAKALSPWVAMRTQHTKIDSE